jgi:hypothetical protein
MCWQVENFLVLFTSSPMKLKCLPFVIAFTVSLALRPTHCEAAIVINNFVLTARTVSFDISGTFPSLVPAYPVYRRSLFFVNPDPAASPGFSLGFFDGSVANFTGTQALGSYAGAVAPGNPAGGDFFGASFVDEFSAGESIFGTLTATWASDVFDPSAVTSLNVFWGLDILLPQDPTIQPSQITGGTYLTSVTLAAPPAIPEPGTWAAAALLVVAATAVRLARRRQ